MTVNTVEQWLSEAIGLDAHALGPQTVADAVKRRMTACGLTKESDYLKRLAMKPAKSSGPDELPALIEMITVPETWFFRDREPFIFLARHVHATWLPAHPRDRLQILSAPCSSGEEPYSIAMALQSAGLTPARYRIDAVDLNPVLLRKAEKGVYGHNSFRSGLLTDCERYFKLEGVMRIVSPEIRAGIRFIHGNLMDPPAFAAEQKYDIIFCRNLLIYQHTEARQHITAKLDGLLKPEGLLFVGHAEMMPQLAERYEPVHHSGAFAYCKIKNTNLRSNRTCSDLIESEHPAVTKMAGPRPWPGAPAVCRAQSGAAPGQSHSPNSDLPRSPAIRVQLDPAAHSLHSPSSRLDCIRALADQGQLDKAAAMCRDLLNENHRLAEAHFLMGVIQVAAGQVQAAEECLGRALYLDADFYEALVHLALLKSRRGDEAGAERMRRHAERVRDQTQVKI
ncbi:MAG: CheR family methyltransferase [Verrucomicrobiota bacterium]